jgi:hypothetical protein
MVSRLPEVSRPRHPLCICLGITRWLCNTYTGYAKYITYLGKVSRDFSRSINAQMLKTNFGFPYLIHFVNYVLIRQRKEANMSEGQRTIGLLILIATFFAVGKHSLVVN